MFVSWVFCNYLYISGQTIYSLPFPVIPSPIELRVVGTSSTTVAISWQPPYNADGVIKEYQVSYTAHGGSEHLHDVQDTTSTELTSLEPHTEYTVRVRAKMRNFGDYCTPITIQTPKTGK